MRLFALTVSLLFIGCIESEEASQLRTVPIDGDTNLVDDSTPSGNLSYANGRPLVVLQPGNSRTDYDGLASSIEVTGQTYTITMTASQDSGSPACTIIHTIETTYDSVTDSDVVDSIDLSCSPANCLNEYQEINGGTVRPLDCATGESNFRVNMGLRYFEENDGTSDTLRLERRYPYTDTNWIDYIYRE